MDYPARAGVSDKAASAWSAPYMPREMSRRLVEYTPADRYQAPILYVLAAIAGLSFLLPFSSSRGHTDEDNKRGSQLKINCAEFLTSTFKWAQAKQHSINAAPQSLRMSILPSVSIFGRA